MRLCWTSIAKFWRCQSLVVALMVVFIQPEALAQITVSKSVIEFSKDNLVQDIDLHNTASHKIYLKVSIDQVIKPETSNPQRLSLDDPRSAPVLVSPKQLVVPPGQRKRLRIILRKPPGNIDDIYRLAIKPFVGDVVIEQDDRVTKQSALKVLLGYDLLLIARPENALVDLQVKRTNSTLTFTNSGNTNVLLRRLMQCNSSGEDCSELQPNRIYAGETYQVKLPKEGGLADYPVKVWQAIGLKNEVNIY